MQLVFLVAALAPLGSGCSKMSSPGQALSSGPSLSAVPLVQNNVVTIGCILDLTGPEELEGRSQQAAINLAVQDLVAELAQQGSSISVQVVFGDSQSKPERAQTLLDQMTQQGIRMFVGPNSDAEIAWVSDYATDLGVIMISPASTSPTLNEFPSLYRIAKNDLFQAKVAVLLMQKDGVLDLFEFARKDVYGSQLASNIDAELKKIGGVQNPPTFYDLSRRDFSGVLEDFQDAIRNEILRVGSASSIGIHLSAFSEAESILEQAGQLVLDSKDAAFGQVHWYGSDGMNELQGALTNPAVADFMMARDMHVVSFAVPKEDRPAYNEFAARINANAGLSPDVYVAAAYDALMLAAKGSIAAGPNTTDFSEWRKALETYAATAHGLTGDLAFDQNGDRKVGSYANWKLQKLPAAGEAANPNAGQSKAPGRIAEWVVESYLVCDENSCQAQ